MANKRNHNRRRKTVITSRRNRIAHQYKETEHVPENVKLPSEENIRILMDLQSIQGLIRHGRQI